MTRHHSCSCLTASARVHTCVSWRTIAAACRPITIHLKPWKNNSRCLRRSLKSRTFWLKNMRESRRNGRTLTGSGGAQYWRPLGGLLGTRCEWLSRKNPGATKPRHRRSHVNLLGALWNDGVARPGRPGGRPTLPVPRSPPVATTLSPDPVLALQDGCYQTRDVGVLQDGMQTVPVAFVIGHAPENARRRIVQPIRSCCDGSLQSRTRSSTSCGRVYSGSKIVNRYDGKNLNLH